MGNNWQPHAVIKKMPAGAGPRNTHKNVKSRMLLPKAGEKTNSGYNPDVQKHRRHDRGRPMASARYGRGAIRQYFEHIVSDNLHRKYKFFNLF